jgi:DNA-binding LytR/AlgR family response regulator
LVHRVTIVNVDAVSGVMREDVEKQFALLERPMERLPISRQFFHLFRQV